MFGSTILDTVIGLILVFFVISTICSSMFTFISKRLNMRGRLLAGSLEKWLGETVYEVVMNHPMVRESTIYRKFGGQDLEYKYQPDWVDPKYFSQAFADLLVKAKATSDPTKLLPAELSGTVQYFLDQLDKNVYQNVEELAEDIEKWFDGRMYNLTELFREYSRVWLAGIAIGVTLFFNLNTIAVSQALWQGPTLRAAVVEAAGSQVSIGASDSNVEINTEGIPLGEEGTEDAPSPQASPEEERNPVQIFQEELNVLDLPVGWTEQELDVFYLPSFLAQTTDADRASMNWFSMVMGWILTVLAVMLGAPFWYTVLTNLVSIRQGEKSDDS
jgi:hypothetical protein